MAFQQKNSAQMQERYLAEYGDEEPSGSFKNESQPQVPKGFVGYQEQFQVPEESSYLEDSSYAGMGESSYNQDYYRGSIKQNKERVKSEYSKKKDALRNRYRSYTTNDQSSPKGTSSALINKLNPAEQVETFESLQQEAINKRTKRQEQKKQIFEPKQEEEIPVSKQFVQSSPKSKSPKNVIAQQKLVQTAQSPISMSPLVSPKPQPTAIAKLSPESKPKIPFQQADVDTQKMKEKDKIIAELIRNQQETMKENQQYKAEMIEKQTKIENLCDMYEQEIQEAKDNLKQQSLKIESLCDDYENEIKEKDQIIAQLKQAQQNTNVAGLQNIQEEVEPVVKEVIREVIKEVIIKVPVEVIKIVEKPVEVIKIVEKPVEVIKWIEKPVEDVEQAMLEKSISEGKSSKGKSSIVRRHNLESSPQRMTREEEASMGLAASTQPSVVKIQNSILQQIQEQNDKILKRQKESGDAVKKQQDTSSEQILRIEKENSRIRTNVQNRIQQEIKRQFEASNAFKPQTNQTIQKVSQKTEIIRFETKEPSYEALQFRGQPLSSDSTPSRSGNRRPKNERTKAQGSFVSHQSVKSDIVEQVKRENEERLEALRLADNILSDKYPSVKSDSSKKHNFNAINAKNLASTQKINKPQRFYMVEEQQNMEEMKESPNKFTSNPARWGLNKQEEVEKPKYESYKPKKIDSLVERLHNEKSEQARKRTELKQKYDKEAEQLYNFAPTISRKSKKLNASRGSNASSQNSQHSRNVSQGSDLNDAQSYELRKPIQQENADLASVTQHEQKKKQNYREMFKSQKSSMTYSMENTAQENQDNQRDVILGVGSNEQGYQGYQDDISYSETENTALKRARRNKKDRSPVGSKVPENAQYTQILEEINNKDSQMQQAKQMVLNQENASNAYYQGGSQQSPLEGRAAERNQKGMVKTQTRRAKWAGSPGSPNAR